MSGMADDSFKDAFQRFEEATEAAVGAVEAWALERTVFSEEISRQEADDFIEQLRADEECRAALDAFGVKPIVRGAIFYLHRDRDDDWWSDQATIAVAATVEDDSPAMEQVYGAQWREISALCDGVAAVSDSAAMHWCGLAQETVTSGVLESIRERVWQFWERTPEDPRIGYVERAAEALTCAAMRRLPAGGDVADQLLIDVAYAIYFDDILAAEQLAALRAPWGQVVMT
ncbi:hypothetical protein WN67_06020 [Mycolicibacterium obuense]|uniref:Uncharacterized protein n=2 Tax=Mycolicibacterium obuense TaxID=1807 RepID=A0A0M2K6U8_9MYCO|nr:hypothetical protein WN67_06020 [Mycolicibacterium obuense]